MRVRSRWARAAVLVILAALYWRAVPWFQALALLVMEHPLGAILPAVTLGLLVLPGLRPTRHGVRVGVSFCAIELGLLALMGFSAILLPGGHPPLGLFFVIPLMLVGSLGNLAALLLVARGWLRDEPLPSAVAASVILVPALLFAPVDRLPFGLDLGKVPVVASAARGLRHIDPRCPDVAAVRDDPTLLARCPGLTAARLALLRQLGHDEGRFGPAVTARLHQEWSSLEVSDTPLAVAALSEAHRELLPDARYPEDSYALLCTVVDRPQSVQWAV